MVNWHCSASPDGWAVWGVVVSTRWWLLVDHCVLRNWDRILVRAVKGLISRAGMVSICPLLWQRDVKLPTNQTTNWHCSKFAVCIYLNSLYSFQLICYCKENSISICSCRSSHLEASISRWLIDQYPHVQEGIMMNHMTSHTTHCYIFRTGIKHL